MAEFKVAKTLIANYFSHDTWRPQSPREWSGPFALPEPLVEYYASVGPVDVTIASSGNPYFLPRLAQLWAYQAGYRYNSITSQLLEDWDDDWLVVADEGADPFILSRATGRVSFALHGTGQWQPELLFDNLEEMVTVFLILGGVRSNVSLLEFTDTNSLINPAYYFEALNQLTNALSSDVKANKILSQLGWITDQKT